VEIYGDQRLVDKIDSIYTEKIGLSDIASSAKRQVKLNLPLGINTTSTIVNVQLEYRAKSAEEKKAAENGEDKP
jgi:YbbR domain-containing protein